MLCTRSVAVALSLLFLTCASAGSAVVFPAGVEQPAPGVYAAEDEPGCCWLSPSAHFTLIQPPRTDAVTFDFVIPPFAAGPAPTALTLSLDGVRRRACCYGIGEHQATFRIRKWNGPTRRVEVIVDSSSRFVPAERGLNHDRRVLTLLLKSVTTVDSATGDVYLGGSPVSANLLLPRWRIILDAAGLALAVGSMAFLLLRRPRYAWIAIVLAAPFLLPVPVYGTTISLEKVVIILTALVLLTQRRFRAAVWKSPGRWILGALLLFVADMAVSSFSAAHHGAAVRETLKCAEYALAFAVVYGAYLIDPDESALHSTVVWVICIISGLALLQPLVEPLQRTILNGHIVPRLAGPLEGPNQLSAFLGISLVMLVALAQRLSRASIFALGIGCVALLLTISRAGIVSFIFGLAIVLILRTWPRHKNVIVSGAATVCVALLVVTAVAALTFPNAQLDRIFGASDAYNGGLGSRAGLWHAAITLWRHHPLLGVGPGNYELLVGHILPGVRTHANGYFFQVLAEQGIVGLAVFLSLVSVPAIIFARRLDSRFAVAGIAVIATLAFHQLLDGLLLYPKVGLEYWAFIAIAAAGISRSSPGRSTSGSKLAREIR